MKTLANHTILYDAECPMCHIYTKAFVRTGMLDAHGREAYQQMPEDICPYVDRQRAVNEIALVDKTSGEVSYGIQSLFKIIAYSFPLFKPLLHFKPFIWLMSKVYAFISYNRRVIIPVSSNHSDIQPTFKKHYRIAYLLFTWLITSVILSHYAPLLNGVVSPGNGYREYLICGGQIIFQAAIISLVAHNKLWKYLGNLMTISFAGSLLLLPAIAASKWLNHQPLLFTGYFMLIAAMMFLEHIRRSKLLNIGWGLTCTWVIYRLLVLVLLLV
ncbi:thiol-disulfide oxidoreductase DCC family protein [Mucilaginibacter paludis]|uniref:DUF393 domain-containing protein n=1 Tax=Mucilaginibacter paludis DSM 18603 TaxID=714943 RepID=H1Y075_9SPHI|nr:hypothetical protein [Mucilaginibacter paludis]EHQ27984.1 hypothetical protein Mucpa_3892 [Mucilaginibacter paludis DSM 18603]